MRRFSLILLMTFMVALAAMAQTQPTGGGTTAPAATTPMPADGTVVTPTSPTGPTTPSITLGTTSPSPVGASNATPGNQAGATNSTLPQGAPAGVTPQSVYTTPMIGNSGGGFASAAANDQATAPRDLLIGGSDSAWAISGDGGSVAVAARQYRAQRAGHKPRMFTNADIARLSGRGVSVVGNSPPPVTNEQTMPASDIEAESGPTTPTPPQPQPQTPNQALPQGQPKSPFNKPSPQVQPQPR